MAGLITLEEFKDYAGLGAKSKSDKDTLMQACVDAASDDLRAALSFDPTLTSYTEDLDGNGLQALPLNERPVAISPLPTVTENGLALSVAFGYSESADVIVDPGTTNPSGAWLIRQNGSNVVVSVSPNLPPKWALGFQNVRVTYSAGFATVPEQFKMVARYLAKRYFDEPDVKKWGVSRRSTGAHSVDFMEKLPEMIQSVIRINRRTYLAR